MKVYENKINIYIAAIIIIMHGLYLHLHKSKKYFSVFLIEYFSTYMGEGWIKMWH